MTEKSRFDKFIPIFSFKSDNRVRLFLHELQVATDAVHPTIPVYTPECVSFNIGHGAAYPKGMQNKFFINKMTDIADEDLHPEWKYFFGAIAYRASENINNLLSENNNFDILGRTVTLAGNPQDIELINAVKKLSNFKQKSLENLVCAILDKIAWFKTIGDPTPKKFVTHNDQLQNLEQILFTSFSNIYYNLSNFIIEEGRTDDISVLMDIYKLRESPLDIWRVGDAAHDAINSLDLAKQYVINNILPVESDITRPFLNSLIYKIQNINCIQVNWNQTIIRTLKHFLIEPPLSKSAFSYKIDKYFISTFLEDYATKLQPIPSVSHFLIDDSIDLSKQPQYFRKADGLLYTKINGVETQIDSKSQEFNKLKVENNCFGTGFKSATVVNNNGVNITYTCTDYLRDCLKGQNIGKCKEFLKQPNFWDIAEDEVNNMLPDIAIRTLRAFEFHPESYYDETAQRRLNRVKTVDEWIKSLAELIKVGKLTNDEVRSISANEKLKHYINLLVKKINNNPSILNPDYLGSADTQKPQLPAYQRLSLMGIPPYQPPFGIATGFERLNSTIRQYTENMAISLNYPLFKSNIIAPYGIPVNFNLVGGGSVINTLEDTLSKENKQAWSLLQGYYLALVQRLAIHNKKIASQDDQKILELLENLKKTEVKLLKTILYTEKYATLLELHDTKDYTNILSIDHLKEFVDTRNRYFGKVVKKQSDLLSIIKTLSDAVIKQNINNTDNKQSVLDVKWSDI